MEFRVMLLCFGVVLMAISQTISLPVDTANLDMPEREVCKNWVNFVFENVNKFKEFSFYIHLLN